MNCKNDRIKTANEVLESLAPGTSLRVCPTGYVLVEWTNYRGEEFSKRWMTRGNDFYPVWNRHWGHGGTASTALSQLVRWVQGKPVMPMATWRYWAKAGVNLLDERDDKGESALASLAAGGYPESTPCVLCGEHGHIGDWWRLDKVSGPCCSMRAGCCQNGNKEATGDSKKEDKDGP